MVDIARIGDKFLNTPIIITDDEEKRHIGCTIFKLCAGKFTEENHKVKDHNHLSISTHILSLLSWITMKMKLMLSILNSDEKFISFSKYINNKLHFHTMLGETNITDITEEGYEHVRKKWEHFRCWTLGEYSDHYLKVDVLLLADVFENFRNICISKYNNIDSSFTILLLDSLLIVC